MTENELYHFGVKGMRWGVRHDSKSISSSSPSNTNKKEKVKKVAKVAGAIAGTATLVAASAYYVKNKNKINSAVNKAITNLKKIQTTNNERKMKKASNYASKNKDKILKSPSKVLKYKKYLSDSDISKATNEFKTMDRLHQYNANKIQRGAKYAQAVLAYATVATTAYGLKNSQLFKDTKNKKNKRDKNS